MMGQFSSGCPPWGGKDIGWIQNCTFFMTFKQSPPGYIGVRGPLIEAIQTQLNALGYNAGTVDGVWGTNTLNALLNWQQATGIVQTGVVDDGTWLSLMATPIPILSQRALQLTGEWEGTGYGGANGNFDGQGITWGVVGFTWGNAELQGILNEILSGYPAVFNAAFGSLQAQMVNILNQPFQAQMTWARSISIHGGQDIEPDWAAAFKALGDAPEVQGIENQHAQHYWDAGMVLANNLGFVTEPGQALCFDIAVQNTITQPMLDELQSEFWVGMSEVDKMQVTAKVVAERANSKYYNDVLTRKMTFVNGYGTVHGDKYNINCWGIG